MKLNELLEGSFRGVRFYFQDGEKKFGRKTVAHEFPNQDDRYVEDLGLNADAFSINVIIGGPNYTQSRNALEVALKQAGPGQFIHPFHGTATVQVMNVTLVEDLTDLGVARFAIEFMRTRSTVTQPTGVVAGPATLLQQSGTALSQVNAWIAKNFKVSNLFPRNFTDALGLLGGVNSTLAGIVATATTGTALSTFTGLLSTFNSDINQLIGVPASLASGLTGLLSGFQNLSLADPRQQLNLNAKLYDFGNQDDRPAQITAERVERVQNRDVINTAVQSQALAYNYATAAQLIFTDTGDLDATGVALEDQYQALLDRPQLDPDVQATLETMRSTIRSLFAEEEVNLYRISTIQTPQLPVTVLAYQYYGDVDLVDTLIGINKIDYPAAVSGAVEVFVR